MVAMANVLSFGIILIDESASFSVPNIAFAINA